MEKNKRLMHGPLPPPGEYKRRTSRKPNRRNEGKGRLRSLTKSMIRKKTWSVGVEKILYNSKTKSYQIREDFDPENLSGKLTEENMKKICEIANRANFHRKILLTKISIYSLHIGLFILLGFSISSLIHYTLPFENDVLALWIIMGLLYSCFLILCKDFTDKFAYRKGARHLQESLQGVIMELHEKNLKLILGKRGKFIKIIDIEQKFSQFRSNIVLGRSGCYSTGDPKAVLDEENRVIGDNFYDGRKIGKDSHLRSADDVQKRIISESSC